MAGAPQDHASGVGCRDSGFLFGLSRPSSNKSLLREQ